jgi:hypothetical protein
LQGSVQKKPLFISVPDESPFFVAAVETAAEPQGFDFISNAEFRNARSVDQRAAIGRGLLRIRSRDATTTVGDFAG